jgi:RNA polymerase sigma-70 factor (ECF subfamily)
VTSGRVPRQRRSERDYLRLVEPHRDELRAHCRRLLGSPEDAEDALQDAMERAWRALPSLERDGAVRSWLYRIATNASLDAARRRARHPLPSRGLSAEDPAVMARLGAKGACEQATPAVDGRRETLQRTMVAALETLTPTQLAVLILRAVAGFSAAETAEMLGTTVPATNSALQRARATLRSAPAQQDAG